VLTVVVLAAGRSQRFGSDKLLHPLPHGDTLLARAVRACGAFARVVVCSPQLEAHVRSLDTTAIVNGSPERGMAYSLRLANAQIDPQHDLAVLPADLPLIAAEHVVRMVESLRGADVAHPVRSDGTPGHPVIFSSRMRRWIEELADNEPAARLRERAGIARRSIAIEEPWPYRDVDVREDLEGLR